MRVWQRPYLAAATPVQTGATAQTQATAQGQAAFNAATHPRGADGKFITTGGTVEVLGPGGKAIAEGQVTAVLTTSSGPKIQIKNPSTGQVFTLSPTQVQQAPQAIATLSRPGTNVIPPTAARAASAGRSDALHGVVPRTGTDPYGNKADPALLATYMAAYKAEQTKLSIAKAKKAVAAAKKAAAAKKKSTTSATAASKKAGGANYIPPKEVTPKDQFKHYSI